LESYFYCPNSKRLNTICSIWSGYFYKVIDQVNKYWILQKLSVYIGVLLFVVYGWIIYFKNANGDYKPYDLYLVCTVISFRFIAFILEEFVDIAIDGELDHDLSKLQSQKVNDNSNSPCSCNCNSNDTNSRTQSCCNYCCCSVVIVVIVGIICFLFAFLGLICYFFSTDSLIINGTIISNYTDALSCGPAGYPSGIVAYVFLSLLIFFGTVLWITCTNHPFKNLLHDDSVFIPDGIEYAGSFYAWGPGLVQEEPWNLGCCCCCCQCPASYCRSFPQCLSVVLCFFPVWLSCIILVPLGILCAAALAGPFVILAICCGFFWKPNRFDYFKKEVLNF